MSFYDISYFVGVCLLVWLFTQITITTRISIRLVSSYSDFSETKILARKVNEIIKKVNKVDNFLYQARAKEIFALFKDILIYEDELDILPNNQLLITDQSVIT
jgi:hypothetical protein